jgi:hypothetical protein
MSIAITASGESRTVQVVVRGKQADYTFDYAKNRKDMMVYSGKIFGENYDLSGDNYHHLILNNNTGDAFPQPELNVYYSIVEDFDGSFKSLKIYIKNAASVNYYIKNSLFYPSCRFYGDAQKGMEILEIGKSVGSVLVQRFDNPNKGISTAAGLAIKVNTGELLLFEFQSDYFFKIQSPLHVGQVKNFNFSCRYLVSDSSLESENNWVISYSTEFPVINVKIENARGNFDVDRFVDEVLSPAIKSVPNYDRFIRREMLY